MSTVFAKTQDSATTLLVVVATLLWFFFLFVNISQKRCGNALVFDGKAGSKKQGSIIVQ